MRETISVDTLDPKQMRELLIHMDQRVSAMVLINNTLVMRFAEAVAQINPSVCGELADLLNEYQATSNEMHEASAVEIRRILSSSTTQH